jgi:hypothetical protein
MADPASRCHGGFRPATPCPSLVPGAGTLRRVLLAGQGAAAEGAAQGTDGVDAGACLSTSSVSVANPVPLATAETSFIGGESIRRGSSASASLDRRAAESEPGPSVMAVRRRPRARR